MPAGAPRQLAADVAYTAWNGYVSNYNNVADWHEETYAGSGETVTFAVEHGDGTLADMEVTTDANGQAATTFSMGTQWCQVRAEVGDMATDGAAYTLAFYPQPAEYWYNERNEAGIFTTLSTQDPDGCFGLAPGYSRAITATVTYKTWEVWLSDQGNIEIRNKTQSSAETAAAVRLQRCRLPQGRVRMRRRGRVLRSMRVRQHRLFGQLCLQLRLRRRRRRRRLLLRRHGVPGDGLSLRRQRQLRQQCLRLRRDGLRGPGLLLRRHRQLRHNAAMQLRQLIVPGKLGRALRHRLRRYLRPTAGFV